MIRSCSPPGVKTTVINPAFYLLVWSPRGLQLHRRALIPLPRGTRGEATTARHESFLDAYALAVQFKQGSARGEPDGCGYISAFAALAGTAIGGLTSFATSWATQQAQTRAQRLAAERDGRA